MSGDINYRRQLGLDVRSSDRGAAHAAIAFLIERQLGLLPDDARALMIYGARRAGRDESIELAMAFAEYVNRLRVLRNVGR